MPNLFDPEWDGGQDEPPFTWRRSRIGRLAGSEQLGASLFEVPPGSSTFPLHLHHANEELLIVLAGRPTLRTLDDERELATGEVVAFPAGRAAPIAWTTAASSRRASSSSAPCTPRR
jgi:uncharacterized cupin superfamily protein